jgi:hypothetical protein
VTQTHLAFDGLYDNGEDYFECETTAWTIFCTDCGEAIDAGQDGY